MQSLSFDSWLTRQSCVREFCRDTFGNAPGGFSTGHMPYAFSDTDFIVTTVFSANLGYMSHLVLFFCHFWKTTSAYNWQVFCGPDALLSPTQRCHGSKRRKSKHWPYHDDHPLASSTAGSRGKERPCMPSLSGSTLPFLVPNSNVTVSSQGAYYTLYRHKVSFLSWKWHLPNRDRLLWLIKLHTGCIV